MIQCALVLALRGQRRAHPQPQIDIVFEHLSRLRQMLQCRQQHLAERILLSKEALEGERKQVTAPPIARDRTSVMGDFEDANR
jgi:hypothetical protein